jgi:aminoglycoside phosphotransferase (APT) family kinase protein
MGTDDGPQPAPEPYLAALRDVLAREYPAWGSGALSVAGRGLNFLVCRVETARFGTLALRTPWVRTLINDTDGVLDARRLLRQEAALADYARARGIPAPATRALHLGTDGVDFLATDFVHGDGSAPDARAFGALMRAIHALPPPTFPLIEGGDTPPHERIAARLSQRTAALARLTGEAFPLPGEHELRALLASRAGVRATLHMDARPANLFTRRGAIVAIVDWGNALVGDPALELARIAEGGQLDGAFLAGYGDDPLGTLPPAIAGLYRLDTVVMLALVFLAEAPNLVAARAMLARARVLITTLREATRD